MAPSVLQEICLDDNMKAGDVSCDAGRTTNIGWVSFAHVLQVCLISGVLQMHRFTERTKCRNFNELANKSDFVIMEQVKRKDIFEKYPHTLLLILK